MAEKANKKILENFFRSQLWMRTHFMHNDKNELKIIHEILEICKICNIFEIPKYDIFNDMSFKNIEEIVKNNDEISANEILNNFEISQLILPSPWTYIGFPEYGPVTVKDHTGIDIFFTGTLITNNMIVMFNRVTNNMDKDIYSFNALYKDKIWYPYAKLNYNPIVCLQQFGIIVMLLYIIDNFQSTTIDTRSTNFKLICNLIDKKRRVSRPQTYYRVVMKDDTRVLTDKEVNDRIHVASECTYAYFVRAHTAHRILRGMMPMNEKTEAYLKKDPRRRIFTSQDQIDPDSLEILTKRGIFWKDGEWISLLPYRVSAHIANSKDGKNPYIPSIHVAT